MSKAIIISHEGKGQYLVDVIYDAAYIQRIIDRLNLDYAQLQFKDLTAALAAKQAQQSKVDDAAQTVYDAIGVYNSAPTTDNLKKVAAATQTALKIGEDFGVAVVQLDFVTTRMDALRRRIALLGKFLNGKRRAQLWCTDLADGKKDRKKFKAGDEVGVMEVNGDELLGQVIRPSYKDDWKYLLTRDGNLMNIAGMTHFEVFYNLAAFPGWQKWRHPYRTGKITAGNPTDGWTVVLDPLHSSEQQIPLDSINTTSTLTGIHATYMSCDDDAFAVKDHVLLDVVISGAPPGFIAATIIGFVDHPKPCITSGFGYYATAPGGTPQEWQHISDETGTWVMKHPYKSDLTDHAFDNSSDPTIRSWIGAEVDGEPSVLEFIFNGSSIYLSGKNIADIPTDHPYRILGAALSPTHSYLYVILTYGSSGTHVFLARKSLIVGTTGENDIQAARTVFLGGQLRASSSMNGQVTANNDTLLAGSLSARATLTATLLVTHEWEFQDIDLGISAINNGGVFYFNASCTSAISAWDYVHGARRSPQVPPAAGAAWTTPTLYESTWKEKVEITISNPDAKTLIAANAVFTNYGRQGALVLTHSDSYDETYSGCLQTVVTHTVEVWSGSHLIGVGYDGDNEVVLNEHASGNYELNQTGTNDGVGHTVADLSITSDVKINFEVALFGLIFPKKEYLQTILSSADSASHPSESSAINYTFTSGIDSVLDVASGTVAFDSASWKSEGFATYDPDSSTWSSTETETTVESGKLYAGTQLDASSLSVDTTFTDRQPGNFIFATPSVNGCVDPEHPPADVHTATNYVYDITGLTDVLRPLTPTRAYSNLHFARSANGKYLVTWDNSRTPGGVTEHKTFLTGSDLPALNAMSEPVIYHGVHAT